MKYNEKLEKIIKEGNFNFMHSYYDSATGIQTVTIEKRGKKPHIFKSKNFGNYNQEILEVIQEGED
jgi:hypothetical protein